MRQCRIGRGTVPTPSDLDRALQCGNCGDTIPASSAMTFEGADYVRHFCGEDCLSDWCAGTEQTRRPKERR